MNEKMTFSERIAKVVQYAGQRPKQYWNGYWYTWNAKAGDYTRGFKEGNRTIVKTLSEDKKEALSKLAEQGQLDSLPADPYDLLSWGEKKSDSSSEPKKEPTTEPKQEEPKSEPKEEEPKKPDPLDKIYGNSKVWSSKGGLVIDCEAEDGTRLTVIPTIFLGDADDENIIPNLELAGFVLDDEGMLLVRDGGVTQDGFKELVKLGVIDGDKHTFENGRNPVNIDKDQHIFLRENNVLENDLPEFAEKTEKKEPEPKEEPQPEPQPEPEPKEEPQTEPEIEEPKEEPEPKEDDDEPEYEDDVLSVGEAYDLVFDEDIYDEEGKKNLIRSWAGNYFDVEAPAQYGDEDGSSQMKYIEFFQSDSVPLETKMEALREFNDALHSRDFGNGVPASYISTMKTLAKGAEDGQISFDEINGALKKLDQFVDKPDSTEKPETDTEEEPKEEEQIEEEPSNEEKDEEEPQETEPYEHVDLNGLVAKLRTAKDVASKNQLMKNWASQFFTDESDELSNKLRQKFISDDFPQYSKIDLLNSLMPRYGRGMPQSSYAFDELTYIDHSVRNEIAEKLKGIDDSIKKNWEEINNANSYKQNIEGWNTYRLPFTWLLTKGKAEKFSTRDAAIKNFRGLISIPSLVTPEEKQEILDCIDYVKAVAALPTTTDFEATMILSEVYWNAKNSDKKGFAEQFEKKCKRTSLQDALEEITSRSPEVNKQKPSWLTKDATEGKPPIKETTERRTLDSKKQTAVTAKDFLLCVEQARAEVMTPEEAQADRLYTNRLTVATNYYAEGKTPPEIKEQENALRKEKKEIMDKKDNLFDSLTVVPSVHEYYTKEIIPKELEEEINLKNESRARFGREPLSEEEIEAYKKGRTVQNKADFDRIEFLDTCLSLTDASNAYYSEDDASEIRRLISEYKEADEQYTAVSNKLYKVDDTYELVNKHKDYTYNHLATCAILKKAFPDRGGVPLTTQEWRERSKNTIFAKNEEFKEIADQVFDVMDIIGRCYNTGAKSFRLPTVRIGFTSRDALGSFDCTTNSVIVDIKKIATEHEFREVLIHELGHWLEHSLDLEYQNAAWLTERTGTSKLKTQRQWEGQKKKTPHITVRPDGYGLKLYDGPYVGSVLATELISTAMETLVFNAAMFAKRSPEHFELLIKNFEECANG